MIWFIIVLFILISIFKWNSKRIESLKATYEAHLSGKDKKLALAAGRAYYSALRGGNLTIYDEQAIANDISAMDAS